jgi:autotransporter-associated beta strand protein
MRGNPPLSHLARRLVRPLAFRPAFHRFRLTLPGLALLILPLLAVPTAIGKECTISSDVATSSGTPHWFGNYAGDSDNCPAAGTTEITTDYDSTNPSNNTLIVESGVKITYSGEGNDINFFPGGYINNKDDANDVTGNRIFFYDKSEVQGFVVGGRIAAGTGNLIGNQVFIYKSSVSQRVGYENVMGANTQSTSTSLIDNQVFLYDSTVAGRVTGGHSNTSSGTAANNQVFLYDSKVNDLVRGGELRNGSNNVAMTVIDNQVFLYGDSTVTGIVSGGRSLQQTIATVKNNALYFNSSSGQMSVGGIVEADFIHFTLPSGIQPNTPVLTVTGVSLGTADEAHNYGSDAKKIDIRTHSLTSGSSYVVLRTSVDQSLLSDKTNYSIYDKTFDGEFGDAYTVTLPSGSGRVVGTFTLGLSNDKKDLQLTVGSSYKAPNTTLTWTGNSGSWANYSTAPGKSPKIWSGTDPIAKNHSTQLQYLDGDTVIFDSTALGTDPIIITLGREPISPASVTVKGDRDYLFQGPTTVINGERIRLSHSPIEGTASLLKQGTGTLFLTSANTYTGGTTIEGGLINFNSLANFGNYTSATGKITLDGGGLQWSRKGDYDGARNTTDDISRWLEPIGEGGGHFDTNNNDVTFYFPITGIGGIVKEGAGRLTLAAATSENDYGDTTVAGGTLASNIPWDTNLALTAEGATYDGKGETRSINALTGVAGSIVTSDGNLSVQSGDFSGKITGTARLIKTGTDTDTLTLRGTSDYTGGTTIEAGTIRVGNDRALGTVGVTMSDNTTLGFAGNHSLNNVFTLQSGGKATFQTDAGLVATLTGAFTASGTGTLLKEGDGKLILNALAGKNSQVGTVEVKAGSLIVGGSGEKDKNAKLTARSGVNVYKDALLGGHGTVVGDVTLGSGGILSPGNSYGHLTVEGGEAIFEDGSLFDVEINFAQPKNGDLFKVVDGKATLTGGIVQYATIDDGTDTYASEGEWKILEADEIEGRFKGVVSDLDFAFLSPRLGYKDKNNEIVSDSDPDAVFAYLILDRIPFSSGDASSGDAAKTWNERATAGALDSLNPDSRLSREIVGTVWKGEVRSLLNELSGEIHATVKSHLLMQDDRFLRRLTRHASLESARPGVDKGFWIDVERTRQTSDSDGNAERARLDGNRISGGHDTDFADDWFGGLAFRLDSGHLDVDRRRSEMKITSATAAFYGGKEWLLGPGTLRFLLTGLLSVHELDSERKVGLGLGRGQKLEAGYDGQTFLGAFETAYRFSPTERFTVEPYAAFAWYDLRLDGFGEKGGTAALRKKKENETYATSTLGMRFSIPSRRGLVFDADLGWRHLYGQYSPESVFAFGAGSDRFRVRGTPKNRDAALLGLGIGLNLDKNVRIVLQYDGEVGGREQGHEGRIVFEVRW